ncbi:hypothetical protein U9M48_010988 [Paspalum notatum var. saurae]|uniref:ADF-H domain-containing protein n=1 Tax=Paspalum notatum var. saurae TaxID=547442 RepID=A0AAQ3WGU4_PASNO
MRNTSANFALYILGRGAEQQLFRNPVGSGLDLLLTANARSGVAVNDECMLKFGELQSKRLHRFITFKMNDTYKEIVVDQVGDRETSYEDFTNSLPENDCRYAIYDFDFVTAEDVQKSRIFYILWSPATAKVRSKMLYASSNQKFKSGLNGIQVELQATDASEISLDEIKDRAR